MPDDDEHARMLLTEYISRYRRNSKSGYVQATAQLSELVEHYVTSPSPATLAQLKLQTRVVDQLYQERANHKLFFSKQKIFEQGECLGKLLVYLAHLDSMPPVFITLHSAMAGVLTGLAMIIRKFSIFFFKKFTHLK